MTQSRAPVVDGLQYANWSAKIFRQMREGGVDAVHVTIAYHENFRETVLNIEQWNRWFEQYPELTFHGRWARDIDTAIDPSPIEDDIGLVEIVHTLGARFMQLTYNNQSLLATGCYEENDPGVTRMGRQVIKEMNRVGLVVDMSHSAEHSTLEAIEISERPIAITHANPHSWHAARRNKSDTVLTMGIDHIGIGSDLCQDQPDSVVEWMRVGRWSKEIDYGEGSANDAGFPSQPDWFTDNRSFPGLRSGLLKAGFTDEDADKLLGVNWFNFFRENFVPRG